MVEVLVASAFVAGGVMAASRLGQPIQLRRFDPIGPGASIFGDDLPCPWCSAAAWPSSRITGKDGAPRQVAVAA